MDISHFWAELLTQVSQFLAQYPGMQTALDLAAVVTPLALLLALPGLCAMAAAGQQLAISRQRSAYAKAARQLSMLAAILGWILVLAGALLLYDARNSGLHPVCAAGRLWSWALVGAGTVCASLHCACWRTLQRWALLHRLLAALGGIAAYLGAYMLLAALGAQGQADSGIPPADSLQAMLIPGEDSLLWNAIYYLPALAVSMAGGLGCLWMLLRRRRDDFGRDYYAAMLPWVARWARNGWLFLWMILLLFTCWSVIEEAHEALTMPAQDILNHAIRLLLWLIPVMLWHIVARSAAPMRHKLTLLLAQLLATGFLVPFYMGLIWG